VFKIIHKFRVAFKVYIKIFEIMDILFLDSWKN